MKSKGYLRDNYTSFAEFFDYCGTYNLHSRLGYRLPSEAWNANPRIQWSTNPADFKRINSRKNIIGNQYGSRSSANRAIRKYKVKHFATIPKGFQFWINRIDEGCHEICGKKI